MAKNKKSKKYPSWMNNEWHCQFCYKYNEPSKIEIIDSEDGIGGEAVRVEYICTNPKCRSKRYKTVAMLYLAHAKRYKDFILQNSEIIKSSINKVMLNKT